MSEVPSYPTCPVTRKTCLADYCLRAIACRIAEIDQILQQQRANPRALTTDQVQLYLERKRYEDSQI